MSANLSVEDVLSTLEARAIFHRDREAFHAQQEEHHRDQRSLHAAELTKIQESLESFRAAAPTALELARQAIGPAANDPDPREDAAASGRTPESRRIRSVVKAWTPQEPFGPTAVAGEVNRRYRDQLKRPVDRRSASNVLRRMHAEGKLHLVRPGKAFHEALYRILCLVSGSNLWAVMLYQAVEL